ncbi:MAG: hypothetical protein IPK79_01065 [Vampirovibrionales bacterium]|nr:hypothetical protein [Vampirovibrionales bacterium]
MSVLKRNRFGELMSWLDSPAGWRWVVGPAATIVTLIIAAGFMLTVKYSASASGQHDLFAVLDT